MKIKLIFAWYDLWIGAFWDGVKRHLYIFPVQCVGVRIHIPPMHDVCPDCGYMATLQDGGERGTRYECIECNYCGPWLPGTSLPTVDSRRG